MFGYFAANLTLAVGVVFFFLQEKSVDLFSGNIKNWNQIIIRIAGESGSGSITAAVVALLIVKRQLAGIELIIPIMKKSCSGLRTFSVENKSQFFKKT